jgi:putative glutamine amidotransferase
MDSPLIGIPTFGRNFERHFSLPAEFVECVRRAGGIPVLMPPGETHLDQWFETIDGLLMPSGVDIDPDLYDGEHHETVDEVDPERDHDEVDLIHQAIEAEMPLLATCRGMQLLNVALGGDLFVHVPECIENAVDHRVATDTERKFGPVAHEVVLDPGSRMASLLGTNRMEPMSWHHQAVDELGDGLTVVGHAPDGVIEALEMPEHPWLFAVQWHPEITAAGDATQQRLFDGLVQAARGEVGEQGATQE